MPAPCLITPPVPEITAARVVLLPSPMVSVPLPSTMPPPLPEIVPTVWLLPPQAEDAAVDRERAARGERSAGPELQGPGIHRRAAAVGVGGQQRERAAAGLGEAAAADDGVGEGERRAGIGVEGAAAGVQRDGARRREGSRRLQGAAAQGKAAAGGAEIVVGGDGDRAAVDRRAARVGVDARQGERAGADLDQRGAGAAEAAAILDRAAHGAREVVGADGELVAAQEKRGAAGDRAGADLVVAVGAGRAREVDRTRAIGGDGGVAGGAVVLEGDEGIGRGDGRVAGGAGDRRIRGWRRQ